MQTMTPRCHASLDLRLSIDGRADLDANHDQLPLGHERNFCSPL